MGVKPNIGIRLNAVPTDAKASASRLEIELP
jgi:hypothetical protein